MHVIYIADIAWIVCSLPCSMRMNCVKNTTIILKIMQHVYTESACSDFVRCCSLVYIEAHMIVQTVTNFEWFSRG